MAPKFDPEVLAFNRCLKELQALPGRGPSRVVDMLRQRVEDGELGERVPEPKDEETLPIPFPAPEEILRTTVVLTCDHNVPRGENCFACEAEGVTILASGKRENVR
jgi:hypothetical protein